MAKVRVEAGLDGSGFRTGLQKLSADAERFSHDLNRKFSLSRTLGKVLEGVGIGSGLALAQTAAEKIAGFWKDAADEAERLEQSSQKELEHVRKRIALRQTPTQQLETAKKELRDAQKTEAAAREKKSGWKSDQLGWFAFLDPRKEEMVQSKEDKVAITEAEQARRDAEDKVDALQKQVDEINAKNDKAFFESAYADDRARAEAQGLDYNEFLHTAVPKKKPAPEKPKEENLASYRENISASSLAAIGGGGNVNAIGPVSPVVAELKTQTAVLQRMLVILGGGGSSQFQANKHFDIQR